MDERIGGAPSVLFDAVAVLPGRDDLAANPAAVDFVSDAFTHCKFVGWSMSATGLLQVAGLSGDEDKAVHSLMDKAEADSFVQACAALRHWAREARFAQ